MKKGDKVMIDDGSWSRSVIDGKSVHELLNFGSNRNEKYIVVETGYEFPNTGSQYGGSVGCGTFNNTVIQAINSGKVVFIEERFLRLVEPTHQIMVDVRQDGSWMYGKIVEISDKLYKEIKHDSQS